MTRRVGPYELRGELARGGMGVVFRAWDPALGREVALKMIVAARGASDVVRRRFTREAEALARLEHPHLVRVHAAGEAEGCPWLAMELVRGESLQARLERQGPLPLAEVTRIGRAVAGALHHAHERGVLHRDLKPSNVLIDEEGRVRVVDFGLASLVDADGGRSRLSLTGQALGTPGYWAPEQAAGERRRLGPRADVYGLGATLYALTTGAPPPLVVDLDGSPPLAPSALRPEVGPALDAVLLRGLAPRPEGRYADAAELARDLACVEEGRAPVAVTGARRRSRLRTAALAGLLAALGLAMVAGIRPWAAAPAAGDPDAPLVLELHEPAEGSFVPVGRSVEVRGRVALHEAPFARVSAGGVSRRVEPGEPFALRVRLPSEAVEVVVAVEGPEGVEGAEVRRRLVRGPAWLEDLPPERRPPLPLPAGVRFGSQGGEYVNERDGSVLVWVPPGTFTMGYPADTAGVADSDKPAHEVTLTRGFFLGKYEVTWAQWERFQRDTGYPHPAAGRVFLDLSTGAPLPDSGPVTDEHPVFNVSAVDAEEYCRWAGSRLPTEAEWEWAAGGGRAEPYPWGAEGAGLTRANLRGAADGSPFTAPVGGYPGGASPFGCLDMAGNVFEWVADPWAPYSSRPRRDPRGSGSERQRVIRGGAWNAPSAWAELRTRTRSERDLRRQDVGLRVARSAE